MSSTSIPRDRSGWEELSGGGARALALLAITLLFSMSTWFSASAVIPQLQELWDLSATTAAWLTIAVQWVS